MLRKDISASDLAREVWGTTRDKRGYEVARNRDRIGHYLNGTSYPAPANLELLAKTLDVPVEELAIDPSEKSNPSTRQGARRLAGNPVSTGELILTSLPAQPGKIRLQVDRVIPWQLAEHIHHLLKEAELIGVTNPGVGEVVGGSDTETDTSENGTSNG
jgi:hypothetical protein